MAIAPRVADLKMEKSVLEFGRELLDGWQKYRAAVHKGMDGAFEEYISGLLERSGDER